MVQNSEAPTSLEAVHFPLWLRPEWLDAAGPDIRLDEFVNVSGANQERLYECFKPILDAGRDNKRRPEDLRRLKFALGCVTANAIVAMRRRKLSSLHYSRASGGGATIYKPDDLTSTHVRHVVDTLAGAGLLVTTKGTVGPPRRGQKRKRSTYRANGKLRKILAELGISIGQTHLDVAKAPVVILRDDQGKNVTYEPAVVAAQTAALRNFNAFVTNQKLTLSVPEAVTLKRYPNFHATTLRRIYNRDFERGGRHYGGWWQGQPAEIRQHIRINDERTVELDYGSFHIRMVYHLAGLEAPADPYDVPEIRKALEDQGVSWSEGRGWVKTTTLAMINAKNGRGLHRDKEIKKLSKFFRPKVAYAAIKKHNYQIADKLFSGYGVTLMKYDSDLCAAILSDALKDEIPVLPVHDSFIVMERHQEWLHITMSRHYREKFGFYPMI